MTHKTVKKLFQLEHTITGIGMGLLSMLLMAVLLALAHYHIIAQNNSFARTIASLILLSPFMSVMISCIRLRILNTPGISFGFWVKTAFLNFLLNASILFFSALLITPKKNILFSLIFSKPYLLLFVLLAGLAASATATLLLKK